MDKKILIIEDYPPTVEMIIAYLEQGFAYDFALDGPGGLEKAVSFKPDLILLDIMLPGMSGLEVCKKLKSDPRTAGIPIIMESAKTSAEDIAIGLSIGAVEYVTKPFEMPKLLELIKKHT